MTRRGFTLVEVILASVITAFLLGTIALSLGNVSRAKASSTSRLLAHLRADGALSTLRRDVASVIRANDLFYTRVVIRDDDLNTHTDFGDVDRDELLLFTNQVRPIQDIDYAGEGSEYETQYRIEEDELGPVLWQRRDPMPDQYPLGGGTITPLVEGIVSFNAEAYDGQEWHTEWESDDQGLPLAIRLTVMATGHRDADDVYSAPSAAMRTIVPIDRVLPPKDLFTFPPELLEPLDFGGAGGGAGGENGLPGGLPPGAEGLVDENGNPIRGNGRRGPGRGERGDGAGRGDGRGGGRGGGVGGRGSGGTGGNGGGGPGTGGNGGRGSGGNGPGNSNGGDDLRTGGNNT